MALLYLEVCCPRRLGENHPLPLPHLRVLVVSRVGRCGRSIPYCERRHSSPARARARFPGHVPVQLAADCLDLRLILPTADKSTEPRAEAASPNPSPSSAFDEECFRDAFLEQLRELLDRHRAPKEMALRLVAVVNSQECHLFQCLHPLRYDP
jgi:hypothetical protein